MSSKIYKLTNVVAFVFTFIVNTFASTAGLNGISTGQVSDLNPTLFTPAGFTFAIWFPIYALLLLFVVYQVLPSNSSSSFHDKVGPLFIISCIANCAWLFLWHYGYILLSVLLMAVLLGSLIAIYLRLGIGKSSAPLKEHIFVNAPFSLYLGWITVATIANTASALAPYPAITSILSAEYWTALVIVVAIGINCLILATRRDVILAAVLVWALFGIMTKQTAPLVDLASQAGMIVVGIGIVIAAILKLKKQ